MLYGLQWLERISKPFNSKVQQKGLWRNWHDFFKSMSSRLIKHADQARLWPLSWRESPSFWEFHTHTFLGLISFWPFLILLAFLGPLISGLVFLVCGFKAPLWPLRPEFWFLLRAVRRFCSCSLCSHLCRIAEDKEDELGKHIIINLNQSHPKPLKPLAVSYSILQGHCCQHVMAICRENVPCVLG